MTPDEKETPARRPVVNNLEGLLRLKNKDGLKYKLAVDLDQARAIIRELCGALENIDQVLDGYCTDDCEGETGEPMRLVDYCTYCLIEKDIDAALARVPTEWKK